MPTQGDIKSYIRYYIYNIMGTPSFIRWIEWQNIFEHLDPKEGERILDIACGGGELSLKIAECGCEVSGIDLSEDAIKRAKSLQKTGKIVCKFMVGDAENLPYPTEYFDKIVSSSSLEHFCYDLKALMEMNRVLKPGGSIVLTVDSFTYPISDVLKERHRVLYHVMNYYTKETLKERFNNAGFMMVKSEYLLNSWITSFFVNNLNIKTRLPVILWIFSFIAYPLCLVSDRLFGENNKGYTLIAVGKK